MKFLNLLLYVIGVLFVVTILIGWGLKAVYADIENISVSISYNVAGIIAAVLGGSGIAAAGIGYAKSKL
jgi:hypothetical protein